MAHFGAIPSDIIDAIITGLNVLKKGPSNPTGKVLSIERIEDDTIESIDRGIISGLPALLVCDAGGQATPANTMQQAFNETINLRIIAVAGSYNGKEKRLTDATAFGCEELCNWGVYYALRAAALVDGVFKPYPTKRTASVKISPEKFIAAWDISVCRVFDIYDDEPEATLITLGLVANPSDADQLFESDNTTPNIDDPATKQGGVVTL